MNENLIKDLKSKYATMIPDFNYQKNEGILVNDGWLALIEEMCGCIAHHENNLKTQDEYRKKVGLEPTNTDYDPVEILQIKEKFGGMRCFFRGGDQYTAGVIQMAEVMSFRICEKCGDAGESRNLPWIRTLCDDHYRERINGQNVIAKYSLTDEKE